LNLRMKKPQPIERIEAVAAIICLNQFRFVGF
jgi:hypothetical protein